MNSSNKNINRAAWGLAESISDCVINNIAKAVKEGKLSVNVELLGPLQQLIDVSVKEGFSKAHPTFMKVVDASLANEEQAFALVNKKAKK